jgi:catechol 2,3-dioxygenase-like lactoylglutathione lyase family enzyme
MKFNNLIPELYVSDFQKSLRFYTDIGFKIEYQRNNPDFAFLSFQKSQIMIQQSEPEWTTGKLEYPFGRGVNFQISVKNINSIFSLITKNNYPIKSPIEENHYKKGNKVLTCKEFLVMDPDGYLLRLSQTV